MADAAPKTVLLVEDEIETARIYEERLTVAGFRVLKADLLEIAWPLFTREKPQLAIVDLKLPDGSGLELCRKIRGHKELKTTPIVILTSTAGQESKESGFEAGADQYLVKPLPPEELLLWVHALLRRLAYDAGESDKLRAGGCEIDLASRIVRYEGQDVGFLTGKEFDLLYFLVKLRPRVLSRKYILSSLWHTVAVDHLVDTHISNLRRKLPQALADKIQTVPGAGYRFRD